MTTKLKLKKGDEVIVITGRDKGKKGEILRAMPKDGKVVVAGVNRVKRHQRPNMASQGGIIEKELPIQVSNVALIDPKDGKPTRVGYTINKDGTKVRVAKRSGQQLDS